MDTPTCSSAPPSSDTLRSSITKNGVISSDSTSIPKIVNGDFGFLLEDVPHLSDYLSLLPTYPNPLQDNPSYSVVKKNFVNEEDTVAQTIVVHEDSPRGTHFRRAGPRERVYFEADEVEACIVTCGGLCPGLNTVVRELVCGLYHMYGVTRVLGIEGGYKGFYSRNTISLTPKSVNVIHKRGGTVLGTSRGGHDTIKIVDSIEDRGINQVYIIGGDGTQRGASVIYEEVRRRGLKVSVVGVPKTIDNDIPVIDKSFGFDTAVEEAQRAISAAHVEAESGENGVGVVKLMGRDSGYIALYATLASRDVDCCLILESPFYLEGPGGLFEYMEKRLKENGHMVIVIAEGAGQDRISECLRNIDAKDASGNKLHQDVGLWISQKIKIHMIAATEAPFDALLKIHVPLIFKGEDVSPGLRKAPVSPRRSQSLFSGSAPVLPPSLLSIHGPCIGSAPVLPRCRSLLSIHGSCTGSAPRSQSLLSIHGPCTGSVCFVRHFRTKPWTASQPSMTCPAHIICYSYASGHPLHPCDGDGDGDGYGYFSSIIRDLGLDLIKEGGKWYTWLRFVEHTEYLELLGIETLISSIPEKLNGRVVYIYCDGFRTLYLLELVKFQFDKGLSVVGIRADLNKTHPNLMDQDMVQAAYNICILMKQFHPDSAIMKIKESYDSLVADEKVYLGYQIITRVVV